MFCAVSVPLAGLRFNWNADDADWADFRGFFIFYFYFLMIKKHWWKGLSVALILYTIIMGLHGPLRPALVDETNRATQTIKVGQTTTIKATGYNTAFTKSKTIRAWLTIVDSIRGKDGLPPVYPIKAEKIAVLDDTHIEASFQIPATLPLSNQLQDRKSVV